MLERILVGLDGSPLAESVLPYVQTLLHGRNAATELTLLSVLHLPAEVRTHVAQSPEMQNALLAAEQRVRAYLQRLGRPFHEQGTIVHGAVAIGDTPTELVSYANDHQIDLIALATHGQFGLGRSVSGSVAETVLLSSEIPLLVIRPPDTAGTVPPRVTQVVVPLDGSYLAEQALAYGGGIAAHLDVPLVLLRVVERPQVFAGTEAVSVAVIEGLFTGLIAGFEPAAHAYLANVASRLAGAVRQVQTVTAIGWPVEEIAGFVERSPGSMLVLTTQGKREALPEYIGSVARRVVQTTNAPTLIVRPQQVAPATT